MSEKTNGIHYNYVFLDECKDFDSPYPPLPDMQNPKEFIDGAIDKLPGPLYKLEVFLSDKNKDHFKDHGNIYKGLKLNFRSSFPASLIQITTKKKYQK